MNFSNEILKSIFQVKDISTKDLASYINGINKSTWLINKDEIILGLKIYRRSTAHLLNYILNNKRETLGIYWGRTGGGYLINGNCKIVIMTNNEVAINMEVPIPSNHRYSNKPTTSNFYADKINKCLKLACKNFIKMACPKNPNETFYINDNGSSIKTCVNEIKILIDHLNGDSLSSYNKTAVENVIGSKMDNQFVISAIQTLEKSIKDLIVESRIEIDKINTYHSKIVNDQKIIWDKERTECVEKFNKQINEFEAQINELKSQSLSF